MNELKVFEYEKNEVRTVVIDDQPWWVAKDICDALGLGNVSMSTDRLKPNEKLISKVLISGQNRDVTLINESGLYKIIIRSNKPEAEQFTDWITSEVLPSIRKTGSYTTNASPLTDWQKEVEVLDSYDRLFRINETSKLGMFRKACEKHSMPTDLLPDYTQAKTTFSMTALVKKFGVTLSVQTINRKLVEKGILKELTRKSRTKGEKKFYSITEVGKVYGENLQSPQNPLETQPHWYEDKFPDLIKLIA